MTHRNGVQHPVAHISASALPPTEITIRPTPIRAGTRQLETAQLARNASLDHNIADELASEPSLHARTDTLRRVFISISSRAAIKSASQFPRAGTRIPCRIHTINTDIQKHSSGSSECDQRKFPAASSLFAAHSLGNTYSLDQRRNIIFSARFEASRHISTTNHKHPIRGRGIHYPLRWQLQARHAPLPVTAGHPASAKGAHSDYRAFALNSMPRASPIPS